MIRIHPEVSALLAGADVAGARAALQAAIRLEHSTIPPYLYALYSLAPGGNEAVAQVIRSVVSDEMLHMTLAVNVLNAIGGRPDVDSPLMLPRYPGHLPGTVEAELVVGLAPFSIALVRDTFLRIEQPEEPRAALSAGPQSVEPLSAEPLSAEREHRESGYGEPGLPLTIGQFYRCIRATLVALGDVAFTGRRQHQVSSDLVPGCVAVTDVRSACAAIDQIIDQGEGTLAAPAASAGPGLAHYYRFAEIVFGRRLIPAGDQRGDQGRDQRGDQEAPPGQRYAYAGDPVPVTRAAVFNAPLNPTSAAYPPGSAARGACDAFNYSYTTLLRRLHAAFNGQPQELTGAIGLMTALRRQALAMMSGEATGGAPVGPTFEWQPVE